MKIEALIATMKLGASEHLNHAANTLVVRLVDMLPDPKVAGDVAKTLGLKMPLHLPGGVDDNPILVGSPADVWSEIVAQAFKSDRLDDLQAALLPLLPKGQPFSEGEIARWQVKAMTGSAAQRRDAEKMLGHIKKHNAAATA